MAYSAKILLDSINEAGNRLTTFELTYPRMVHSELLTHKMLSRNSSSSRAIPIQKMIDRVVEDPVLPVWWGKNQSGMQANEELIGPELQCAKETWLEARDNAVRSAKAMVIDGAHKQIVNRLLEPWMWITVIVTGTEFGNLFALRCHEDAQPEIRRIIDMACMLYFEGPKPKLLQYNDWHLPLIQSEDWPLLYDMVIPCDYPDDAEKLLARKISVARCARVSYLTHDGKRDLKADLDLYDRLLKSGHMSPFEHVARPVIVPADRRKTGNFRGWVQFRKTIPNENRSFGMAEYMTLKTSGHFDSIPK